MLPLLARFFKREGDFSFWRNIILIAIVSGIANAGLLAIINLAAKSTKDEALNYIYLITYIIVFIIFFFTKKISMIKSTSEIERIVKEIRVRIFEKIQKSELLTIESIEKSTIFTKFTRDSAIITQSANMLVSAAQSMIMVFFAFIYIFLISPLIFYVIIVSITFIIILDYIWSKELEIDMIIANDQEEEYFNSLNSTLIGFKELKMNTKKSQDIAKKQNVILEKLLKVKINLSKRMATNIIFTEIFLYTLLAVIIFVVPHLVSEESSTIIQITATLLFVIGPLDAIVSIAPMGIKTIVSIHSLFTLEDMLDRQIYNSPIKDKSIIKKFNNFKEIKLENISFYYKDEKLEKGFGISSINLSIPRGSITFIIGGNGSGKSTFIKTLLRLYPPTDGEISVDNMMIDEHNYQAYRDMFSIILGDFYLFQEIHSHKDINYTLMYELLKEMKLEKKTKFINGKFTTINLSTGQKKRLALIITILEDKPVYVFDEWAADQDPSFRKYFYEVILQRLKKQGKTIIAVTHDDAYFQFSDKVMQMDYGRLIPYKGVH